METIVYIPESICKKIDYFHQRFTEEWSGPAWYSINEVHENGFPKEITLEHFEPLDLGSHVETEWEASRLGPMLPEIYKDNPELKDCMKGLIHSHHTMSPNPSKVDTKTAQSHAPKEDFYVSVVVSMKQRLTAEALIGYTDTYGFQHYVDDILAIPLWYQEGNEDWIHRGDQLIKWKKAKEAEKKKKKNNKGWSTSTKTANGRKYTTGYKGSKNGKTDNKVSVEIEKIDNIGRYYRTQRDQVLDAAIDQYLLGNIGDEVVYSTMEANGWTLTGTEFSHRCRERKEILNTNGIDI